MDDRTSHRRSRDRRHRRRWGLAVPPERHRSRDCRRSTAGAGRTSRPTGAATGRSGFSWCCSSCRCSPSSSPTTSRFTSRYDGKSYLPGVRDLSGNRVRRRVRDRGRLSRSVPAEADRREGRHHDLAADPLFLRHPQSRSADAGAVAADLAADRGSNARAVVRTQGPAAAAAISNTTGSAPTIRAATWWRG